MDSKLCGLEQLSFITSHDGKVRPCLAVLPAWAGMCRWATFSQLTWPHSAGGSELRVLVMRAFTSSYMGFGSRRIACFWEFTASLVNMAIACHK